MFHMSDERTKGTFDVVESEAKAEMGTTETARRVQTVLPSRGFGEKTVWLVPYRRVLQCMYSSCVPVRGQ